MAFTFRSAGEKDLKTLFELFSHHGSFDRLTKDTSFEAFKKNLSYDPQLGHFKFILKNKDLAEVRKIILIKRNGVPIGFLGLAPVISPLFGKGLSFHYATNELAILPKYRGKTTIEAISALKKLSFGAKNKLTKGMAVDHVPTIRTKSKRVHKNNPNKGFRLVHGGKR